MVSYVLTGSDLLKRWSEAMHPFMASKQPKVIRLSRHLGLRIFILYLQVPALRKNVSFVVHTLRGLECFAFGQRAWKVMREIHREGHSVHIMKCGPISCQFPGRVQPYPRLSSPVSGFV